MVYNRRVELTIKAVPLMGSYKLFQSIYSGKLYYKILFLVGTPSRSCDFDQSFQSFQLSSIGSYSCS